MSHTKGVEIIILSVMVSFSEHLYSTPGEYNSYLVNLVNISINSIISHYKVLPTIFKYY